MDNDVLNIVTGIKEVSAGILMKDITIVKGFNQRQTEKLAQQTIRVKRGIASGNYSEKKKNYVLNELKLMTRNFVDTLIGIVTITIEKLLNALVRFLYEAVGVVV